jgi:DNA-binding NarL/FixJ family response regulator
MSSLKGRSKERRRIFFTVDDDDDFVRDSLRPVLKDANTTWQHASTVLDAKKLLEQNYAKDHKPDLIIMDLQIKSNNTAGIQLLKIIRKNRSLRSVPVVMLSVSPLNEKICSCYKAGANLYFQKRETNEECRPIVRHLTKLALDIRLCLGSMEASPASN